MDPSFLLLLLLSLSTSAVLAVAQPSSPTSSIIVTGSVFCDVCYNNSFTRLSYFLPGVDVQVECKFQANAPRTTEQIMFSVNRTTDRYGVYRLDIPSVDGVDCVEGPALESFCEASLLRSSVPGCNVPGVSTTSKEITVKSRSTNLCVYGVSALSYRPFKRNSTLCGNKVMIMEEDELLSDSFNSSKFFLPYFPWPLPQFPPWPSLPPLPALPPLPPLPPFPSFPPFQFPPLPPQPPSLPYPPISRPPGFNPGHPRSWIPNIPSSNPPPPPRPINPSDPRTWIPGNPFHIPPPPINPRDPRTWIPGNPFHIPPPPINPRDPRTGIPGNPFHIPPPPPAFNLRDPRTWIPTFPPSPNSPQSQQP